MSILLGVRVKRGDKSISLFTNGASAFLVFEGELISKLIFDDWVGNLERHLQRVYYPYRDKLFVLDHDMASFLMLTPESFLALIVIADKQTSIGTPSSVIGEFSVNLVKSAQRVQSLLGSIDIDASWNVSSVRTKATLISHV